MAAKPIARLAYNAVSKDASRRQRYSEAWLYIFHYCTLRSEGNKYIIIIIAQCISSRRSFIDL